MMRKLLITLLTLGFIAGAALVATAEGQDESMMDEGPMELSWQGIYGDAVVPGNPIQMAIEERFNVKITDSPLARRPQEPIDLMIGANEHPDAMYSWTNHDQWYGAGAYRPIPVEMIREHAPNLARDWDTIGPGAWMMSAVPGDPSALRGIPRGYAHQAGAGAAVNFRYDWLGMVGVREALGLSQDMTSSPDSPEGVLDSNPGFDPGHWFISYHTPNIVDVEAALEAIVAADPVGAGRTIGYSGWPREGRPCYWWSFGAVCQAYGVSSESWWIHSQPDGGATVHYGWDNVKTALKTLQRWYQKGILDSEIPAFDRAAFDDKVGAGLVAMYGRGAQGCWNTPDGPANPVVGCLARVNNPDFQEVMVHAVTAPDGTYGLRHENTALPLGGPGEWFVVRHDVSDEKLAKILQIYDFTTNTCEGLLLSIFGIEGTHYNVEGNAEMCTADGIEAMRAGGVAVRATADWAALTADGVAHYFNQQGYYTRLYGDGFPGNTQWEPLKSYNQWRGPGGLGTTHLIRMYKEDVFGETDHNELRARYKGALDTIHGEFMYKAMTTDLDIDAEWPKYIAQLNSAGMAAINAELNKLQYTVEELNTVGVTCGDSGCVANS